MSHDWRQELRKHPRLQELNRRVSSRRQQLANDKQFVIQTAKLQSALKNALAEHRKVLFPFLQKSYDLVGPRLPVARKFVRSMRNKGLKKLLGDYLNYVARFGVQ